MESLVGGILFVILGVYLLLKPSKVATTLQRFYGNYPLVRHAGQEQLRSRNRFVVVLGIAFIAVGIVGFVYA